MNHTDAFLAGVRGYCKQAGLDADDGAEFGRLLLMAPAQARPIIKAAAEWLNAHTDEPWQPTDAQAPTSTAAAQPKHATPEQMSRARAIGSRWGTQAGSWLRDAMQRTIDAKKNKPFTAAQQDRIFKKNYGNVYELSGLQGTGITATQDLAARQSVAQSGMADYTTTRMLRQRGLNFTQRDLARMTPQQLDEIGKNDPTIAPYLRAAADSAARRQRSMDAGRQRTLSHGTWGAKQAPAAPAPAPATPQESAAQAMPPVSTAAQPASFPPTDTELTARGQHKATAPDAAAATYTKHYNDPGSAGGIWTDAQGNKKPWTATGSMVN